MQANYNQCHIPDTKRPLHTRGASGNTDLWLKDMSERDTALWGMPKPLWVINNKMYDLTQFSKLHPGGRSWIQLTKGQDITVLFRTHHLQYERVGKMLDKYYFGECPIKHRPRFDFDETGHHDTIRKRILSKFSVQELQNTSKTQIKCALLLLIWLILLALTGYLQSYVLAIISGFWGLTNWATGHLFGHKKDTHIFRHLFLLIGYTAKEQQIMHAISHHPYTNTMLDYQYGATEPFMSFTRILPQNKWYSFIVFEIFFMISPFANVITKLIIVPLMTKTSPSWQHAAIFLEILYLQLFTHDWSIAIKLFAVMTLANGFFIGKMILCPHRQDFLWSEGAPEVRDYVLHQVVTSTDFCHTSNPFKSLICYTGFDIHILHHLFPTIDHHILPWCNKIFVEYCKEKGIKIQLHDFYDCNKNMQKILRKKIPFDIKIFYE